MYDLDSWSKERREEALMEAQRRSLAKQGKGDPGLFVGAREPSSSSR